MQLMSSISAALLACCALPSGLLAADEETRTVTRQVIQAHKVKLETMTREISQQHGGQLARFEDAVCIAVSGFEDPYNAIFAKRMAQDAAQAGLGIAKAGCHPNIVVLVTDHPQQELMSLARHDSFITSIGAKDKDLKLLAASAGPSWTLTFTELRSTFGGHLHVGSEVDDQVARLNIYDSTIINLPQRQDIAAVLMVIDSSATLGKNLGQIADYAAFRSLADLRNAVPATGEPTILTLFKPGAAPDGLSSYDLAYLKGLYSGPSSLKAEARIHEIVSTAMHADAKD
jgi:hypothetical protein